MKIKFCPQCGKANDRFFQNCLKCKTAMGKVEETDIPNLPNMSVAKLAEMDRAAIEAMIEEEKRKCTEEHQKNLAAYQEKLATEDLRRKKEIQANREKFKANGDLGYYEYKVISLRDAWGGRTNTDALQNTLSLLGRDGWRLVNSFTNELGKNSMSVSNIGTNSTVDEAILIFERYVPFD